MRRLIVQWIVPHQIAAKKENPTILLGGNGPYVKDYDYSQGYFTCDFTDDPLKAMDFTGKPTQFQTFFAPKGAEIKKIEILYKFID